MACHPKAGTSQAPNLARGHEPDRKDHFIQQEESSAPARLRKFADVSGRNRHFAANADALHKAADEQRGETSGERTAQRHHGHDRDAGRGAADPSEFFGQPAEQQRADKLPDITGPRSEAALPRGNVPQPNQNRQGEGERERIEGVEESRAAHDDAGFGVPSGERHALHPRDQAGRIGRSPGNQIAPRATRVSWIAISSGHSIGVRCRAPGIMVSVEFGMASCNRSDSATGVA